MGYIEDAEKVVGEMLSTTAMTEEEFQKTRMKGFEKLYLFSKNHKKIRYLG